MGRPKKNYEYLIGKKFGKLKVLETSDVTTKNGQACLKCLCECGVQKYIAAHHLTEDIVSCGCWKIGRERALPTFMKKIEKTDKCWLWKGQVNKAGYGRHCCKYAHRLSYIYHIGEIPMDKIICHKCNNKLCVNPDHLYAGTPYDNTQDMKRDGVFVKRSLTSKRWNKT
jgi:hypothetical protein